MRRTVDASLSESENLNDIFPNSKFSNDIFPNDNFPNTRIPNPEDTWNQCSNFRAEIESGASGYINPSKLQDGSGAVYTLSSV